MSKKELFLELAKPNKDGISRWVHVSEFVGKFKMLQLGNGCDFARKNSSLAREFIVEFDKSLTKGNRVDAIRLNRFNRAEAFNQAISKEIRDFYKDANCVMLGIRGTSENTKIEIDHKNGRKNDYRVSNLKTQHVDDFQPLCKAANDAKRQICKRCKQTNLRWDAKNIKGNPYSFYKGTQEYREPLGCEGCYQFDPVKYRKEAVRRVAKEAAANTADFIMKKLYPEQ